MRIMFLNQAPRKSAAYEAAKIEAQLNSYASPGTKVEIVFPDEYEGSQLYDTIGAQSVLNGLHHMMETPAIVRKIFWLLFIAALSGAGYLRSRRLFLRPGRFFGN